MTRYTELSACLTIPHATLQGNIFLPIALFALFFGVDIKQPFDGSHDSVKILIRRVHDGRIIKNGCEGDFP